MRFLRWLRGPSRPLKAQAAPQIIVYFSEGQKAFVKKNSCFLKIWYNNVVENQEKRRKQICCVLQTNKKISLKLSMSAGGGTWAWGLSHPIFAWNLRGARRQGAVEACNTGFTPLRMMFGSAPSDCNLGSVLVERKKKQLTFGFHSTSP